MEFSKWSCLLLILHSLSFPFANASSRQCGPNPLEFNVTNLGIITCVTDDTLSRYPNNSITWTSANISGLSIATNNLDLSAVSLSPGISLFQCNFTIPVNNSTNMTNATNTTNLTTNTTTCDFSVTITALPTTLTISPTVDTVVYPNATLVVECTASGGFPPPSIIWILGSAQVSSNSILNFSSNEDKIGDDLNFVCVAGNSLGNRNLSTTITVKAMPPSVSISPPASISIGDSTTLTCTVTTPLTENAPQITWLFNDVTAIQGNRITFNSAQLMVTNASRMENAGNYSCRAFILNSDNVTATAQLTVNTPNPGVRIAANETSTLTVTESIALECVVTPLPFDDGLAESIMWYFPDTSVRTPDTNPIQTISMLELTDRGTYTCSARVGNSNFVNSTLELMIVPLAPGITINTTNFTPLIGDRLEFTCGIADTSNSNVSPTILWFFDSAIISGQSNTTLVIPSVGLSDTGRYHCSATVDGSDPANSSTIDITVYQNPVNLATVPLFNFNGTVIEGETTGLINCTAMGTPQPEFNWFDEFNGRYSNPLNVALLNNTANGTFTCRASNSAGNNITTLTIRIIPPAPMLSIVPSVENPVLNRSFSLTCNVTGQIPIERTLSDFMFTWRISGSSTVLLTSQVYTFIASASTNGSVYECSATVAGSGRGVATGDALILQSVPTIITFNVPEFYTIGNLTLPEVSCIGNAVPSPTTSVTYVTNMGEMISPPQLIQYGQDSTGLEITVTCLVSNLHGDVSDTETFTLQIPVVNTRLEPNVTSIGPGESFELICSVMTDPSIPLIDVSFEIQGNVTQQIETPAISADNSSSTVIIGSENATSMATYLFSCTVSIQGGKISDESPNIFVYETVSPTAPLELTYIYIGIAAVASVLFIILIILTILIVTCCIRGTRRKRDIVPGSTGEYVGLHSPIAEQSGYSFPILVAKFSETYEMLLEDNQHKLKEQYQQLVNIKSPAEEAKKSINGTKNRYPDVLAYDHSRVIISKSQGTDYINANFMEGFRPKSTYIAAQGPLGPPKYQMAPSANAPVGPELNTVSDFWRMVWEHNITTIIMLTNLIENNRLKCALYWPEDTKNYGRIRVRFIEESQFCDYIIRKFLIERIQVRNTTSTARQVTQFHFVAWPDHGVPLFPISMLQFVKRVRSHINQTGEEDNGPNLVHCSAGVGRTGTFICLDIILQQLTETAPTIDIWKETSKLRQNRNHMVQEYLQYEFVHQAINEHIHFGDTECSAADFPKMISYLNEVTEENPYKIGMSRLEIEFKKLSMKVMANQHRIAMRNENAGKNRFINTMPFDSNCVKLNPIPGIAGSDYINASYIDSDKTHRAFIATQGPLKSTMEDFWRMIVDIRSNIIVMLTENTEDKTEDYFSFSHIHYGPFHIQTTKKHIHNDYVHRELLIRIDDKHNAYNLHHFQLTKLLAPIHSMKDCAKGLLSLITGITVTVQPDEDGEKKAPMVVHCGTGNGMTGVFITVCVILQRLEYEDRIDIFNTVKRLRMQRVAMVQTADQYDLCYRTVMEYLQSSPST